MTATIQPAQLPKQREAWIDVIRGFSMLLVVYAHVLAELFGCTTNLNSLFQTTRMPLFFFISGFFMYSVDFNGALLWKRFKNRLAKQLLPTIILFTIFVAIALDFNFVKYILHESKAGYWFTYVSVLYFITLSPLFYLFTKLRMSNNSRIITLVVFILMSILVQYLASYLHFYKTSVSTFLSFAHYATYLKYLAAGSIFRVLWIEYRNTIIKLPIFVITLIGFIACYTIGGALAYLVPYFGIYIVLYAFNKIASYHSKSKILDFLSFIGSLTLEIYLLHYFILFCIKRSYIYMRKKEILEHIF